MKKLLAISLAFMLLLTLCACGEDKTDPTTASTTTASTTTASTTTALTTAPTTVPTTPSNQITEAEALEIASELLGMYNWYSAVGACCDMEYVEGDMSAYLSDAQKDIYIGSQQKITCCKNSHEVNAHLHHMFAEELIESTPDDLLFTDNDGNLYIILYPTGLPSYLNHSVVSYDNETIVLQADALDGGEKYGSVVVTCNRVDCCFVLSSFEFTPVD